MTFRRGIQRLLSQVSKQSCASVTGRRNTVSDFVAPVSSIVFSSGFGSGSHFLSKLPSHSTPFPISCRGFSSRNNDELLSLLRAELRHEKDSYQPLEEAILGPPAPFKIDDKVGSSELVLRRSFNREDIAIAVSIPPQPYNYQSDEGEEEDELIPQQSDIQATVTIVKDADSTPLEFQVSFYESEADGQGWEISHVAFNVLGDDYSGVPYTGPEFSQLDEKLQETFTKYLKVRGINSELAQYLHTGLEHKEQLEYMNWLENVSKFVAT